MTLLNLKLRNFRNYARLELTCSKSLNLIQGDNAQGKSNLLEAIHFLTITRSFRTNQDRDLVKHDCDGFDITGEFQDEFEVRQHVHVHYERRDGKTIALNRKKIKNQSLLIGKFPIVQFTPESHKITSGPPAERRRFIDILLCQSSSSYLSDLQDYNRVLKQRNALLAQSEGRHHKELFTWDQSLADYGCRIITARYKFVHSYLSTLQQAYGYISSSSQDFRLRYRSKIAEDGISPERFLESLSQVRQHELRRRQTMLGPHRDDLVLAIDGNDLKKYGSRGEHKSALMALKMAESEYLKEKTGTTPIVLLDDLTSELDRKRTNSTLEFFAGCGQVFVTTLSAISNKPVETAKEFSVRSGEIELLPPNGES